MMYMIERSFSYNRGIVYAMKQVSINNNSQ